ncbi:MAG: hypothetical protein WBM07_02015 [Chitinivibrionales bacterium]
MITNKTTFFFLFAFASFLSLFSCKHTLKTDYAKQELLDMGHYVEKQVQNQSFHLSDQLMAFSRVVAADREFSMKLLVENKSSAPEVTEIAPRFMEPMGLSMLEIADSQHVLLSCGQFPANAGRSVADKEALFNDKGVFIEDNVKGQKVLTLQALIRFKILDAGFYCAGGQVVDENFVTRLSPGNGFRLLLKQGQRVMGMENVESISDVKDSTIIINNKTYQAMSFALPFAGPGDAPSCILINENALPAKK